MKNWYVVLFLAIVFGVSQKAFFGLNFPPQAPLDVMCDGVTLALLAMAFMTRAIENKK